MEISFFNVLLSLLPPLAVLILMVGFQWGGSKAGPVGWIVALIIALVWFGVNNEILFYTHIRSVILTLDVIYIVWAALLLYFVVNEAGALGVIADWFVALTRDDVLRVLLLGWVFTSFLQGVGGFGVPVAVAAPLLVGLGLPPLAAVVIPSIGHAWAVTFGSLGSSFIILVGVTGLDANHLTPAAATLLGASALTCGLLAAHAYKGWGAIKRAWPAILAIGMAMAIVQYIVTTNGLWNIGSAVAGITGLFVGLWVTRWPVYRNFNSDEEPAVLTEDKPPRDRPLPSFPMAIAGYVILVILAFTIKGVAPLKEFFGQIKLNVAIPELETNKGWVTAADDNLGVEIFAHTGAILLYSATIAYLVYRHRGFYAPAALKTILDGTRQKGAPPAIGILSMVAMATIMSSAGMTRTLAEWMSQSVPPDLYAFVATLIGALGAFMTGSNTNSNAVFATLQMDTAILLGLSVPLILGTQTAAGAIASLLAPAKIMVGASTVGMGGNEGVILRKLMLYGTMLLLFIAVLSFILLLADGGVP